MGGTYLHKDLLQKALELLTFFLSLPSLSSESDATGVAAITASSDSELLSLCTVSVLMESLLQMLLVA